MDPIRVSSLTILPVLDGYATLQPSMFAGADGAPADWTAHQHLVEADGSLRMPVGTFVVCNGDRTVMLDAGVGVSSDPMFEGHALLDNLAAVGIERGEIDTIVVSHLHSDHSGWLEPGGAPRRFPPPRSGSVPRTGRSSSSSSAAVRSERHGCVRSRTTCASSTVTASHRPPG